ncbi:MAG: ECF transporter S component [Clostridiales bacterium]|nr:ECF transporter S component [Clostridiales bacterium]
MENQQEIATPDNITSDKVRSQALKVGTTKWLAHTALFTSIALLMKVIGQIGTLSNNFKITPIYTVWLLAAASLGPVGGATVCFTSDLLIALIFPAGVFNPFITIVWTLYGLTAGLLFKYFPVKSYTVKLVVAGAISAVLFTFILDSLAIWGWCKYYLNLKSYFGNGKNAIFGVYMLTRLFQLVVALANIPVAVALLPVLNRLKLLPPLTKKYKKSEEKLCPISL